MSFNWGWFTSVCSASNIVGLHFCSWHLLRGGHLYCPIILKTLASLYWQVSCVPERIKCCTWFCCFFSLKVHGYGVIFVSWMLTTGLWKEHCLLFWVKPTQLTYDCTVCKKCRSFLRADFASCTSVPFKHVLKRCDNPWIVSHIVGILCYEKSYRVNRPSNSIHFHMIDDNHPDDNHPDNVLAFCLREILRLLQMIEEESQKHLERPEYVMARQFTTRR